MKVLLSVLIAITVIGYTSAATAEQVLTCDVQISTLESSYHPIFGFSGERTWTGVTLRVTDHNVVIVSGLGNLSASYIPEKVVDDGIQFVRQGIRNHPDMVVRGTLKRYSGKLFLTEEDGMFGARFYVTGQCAPSKRLF